MGCFFSFKLHLVINDYGELMAVKLTESTLDDHISIEAISQLISSLKSLHSTLLSKTHSCQTLIYYNLKSTWSIAHR
ncbi:TPA: hypothetical protein RG395_001077 [Legionella pneumophila]|nr:transposase [Legionella pneumophila subsp. fraseri]HAT1659299.1 hypothetical protein [Legionella pneumophila]HAT1773464.1 hypothetical protein [Legionella pneumophila]HAT1845481.1 hypothetical protein [Legionella pneumophila]HAT1860111.1 hypothetical protein [Legionella pneumophila]